MSHFFQYFKQVSSAVSKGNATEHTHRPALKSLIESLSKNIVATNEPKRIKCGAPDYIVTRGEAPLGYIEAKDVGESLDKIEKSDQMKRYQGSLTNLILTDYLEFRWYVDGKHRMTARLANENSSKPLSLLPDGEDNVNELLQAFLNAKPPKIGNPKELASRMANMARLIRSVIEKALEDEDKGGSLHQQMDGFRKVLLHDLKEDQFSDMYAQTIAYGLFAARCNAKLGQRFTRELAPYQLPKTNPFLRTTFSYIAGSELDERLVWIVDDLAELLNCADMESILRDFGHRTRQQDPVVHFYETFLSVYDPKMREARGVYYTPEPVVSYIVRSVDYLLRTEFGLDKGLADSSKITVKTPDGKGTQEVHKVQILDPATGTGTFLHGVIDHIAESFASNKGMWSSYVSEHLLPRLFGFELLMAPYAVAHLKLGLQLAESGYDIDKEERLGVYLTNSLEEANHIAGMTVFAQSVVLEANAASEIKKNAPVMVVLGNPPYSGHSANTGDWIRDLLRGKDNQTGKVTGSYFMVDGKPLGERNPKWLNDDYVKFLRFAQWRIEETGHGILAFITNHGYLDNPTFRGMRQSLMHTFDDIYILDLHGNSKKKEHALDGGKDENVFDIQQGVAIGLFVKRPGASASGAVVRHAELYGLRQEKYDVLLESDLSTTKWKEVSANSPAYFFIPQDERLKAEYEKGWKITEIMPVNSVGIVTARDGLTIHMDENILLHTITDFAKLDPEIARIKYKLGDDAQDWKVKWAQQDLLNSQLSPSYSRKILYRPFDVRFTYYTGKPSGFHCRPRNEVMRHMLSGDNFGIGITRSVETSQGFQHAFVTSNLFTHHSVSLKEVNYILPIYTYPTKINTLFDDEETEEGRNPNLSPKFIAAISKGTTLSFIPDGRGDLNLTIGPEDIFSYLYSVLHSPTYRLRYSEFLKSDFPHLPLTSQRDLFRELCRLGNELVGLHLMEKKGPDVITYPIPLPKSDPAKDLVETVRYVESIGSQAGRVYINKAQYFDGMSLEVWEFQVGGYQVANKWLKDRKGRSLSYDDIVHYQQTISALAETIRLMEEIDEVIDAHGGWPLS